MTRECVTCGTPFEAQRSTARYCGEKCKKRTQRSQPSAAPDVGIVEAYRRELAEAGRLDTALGQHVLVLAERMTVLAESGSGIAALSRQLTAAMSEAMKGAAPTSRLDELRRRRDAKQRAAG